MRFVKRTSRKIKLRATKTRRSGSGFRTNVVPEYFIAIGMRIRAQATVFVKHASLFFAQLFTIDFPFEIFVSQTSVMRQIGKDLFRSQEFVQKNRFPLSLRHHRFRNPTRVCGTTGNIHDVGFFLPIPALFISIKERAANVPRIA